MDFDVHGAGWEKCALSGQEAEQVVARAAYHILQGLEEAAVKSYEVNLKDQTTPKAALIDSAASADCTVDDGVDSQLVEVDRAIGEDCMVNPGQLDKQGKGWSDVEEDMKSSKMEDGMGIKLFDMDVALEQLKSEQESESGLRFSIWDYGGQRVFYHLHHLFLSRNGVYLVVFNMKWFFGPEERALECMDYLHFWYTAQF